MSQLPKAKGGKPSKRKAGAAAAQTQTNSLAADDRVVRPRTDQSAAVGSKGGPAAAAASSVPAVLSPLMRLAVVERQLIMQLLNIESLARFFSTCKQMRAEAMHKAAGKFIRAPAWNARHGYRCTIGLELEPEDVEDNRLTHQSPLFRKHMPMTLTLVFPEAGEALELHMVDPLLRKADRFSRITKINIPSEGAFDGDIIWPEKRMLAFLKRPSLQRVEMIYLGAPSWLKHPTVQAALFALPCLATINLSEMPEGVIKSALAQAHALRSLTLSSTPVQAGALRAIRALPGLTELVLPHWSRAGGGSFADVVWSLPSTLESLSLSHFDVSEAAASRSLLKAMFLRMPALRSFHAAFMQPAPLLQGMLDAGVQSLPKLRNVSLHDLPSPLDPALLRRFLHRFPGVTARLSLPYQEWDTEADAAFGRRFGGWPRVQLRPTLAENDGPPAADKADDVDGPSIVSAVDPGSDDDK